MSPLTHKLVFCSMDKKQTFLKHSFAFHKNKASLTCLELHGWANHDRIFICGGTVPWTICSIIRRNHCINKFKGHSKLPSDLTEISEWRQILMPPWITSKCWLSVCLLRSGVWLESQIFIPLFCSASCKSITPFTYPEDVNHRASSGPLKRLEG